MISVPPLILLQLTFRVIHPIKNLPFYHGAHWSALFRNLLRTRTQANASLSDLGISIHPIETGVIAYEEGDPIHLGLTFPVSSANVVDHILHYFNASGCGEGHFVPGRTILLEEAICRISGRSWDSTAASCLTHEIIEDEIELFSSLDEFSLHLYSPLRLPRPKGLKNKGHHYCDEDFFLSNDAGADPSCLRHFMERIRLPGINHVEDSAIITGGSLHWLDFSYGSDEVKTIGGVVGKLKVSGRPSISTARLLVKGQYVGAGKNPAFGLGFYLIPELVPARKVAPLKRGKPLFERAFSARSLEEALKRLPHSSPGPDLITVNDLKRAGSGFIGKLSNSLIEGSYRQGGVKKYHMPKPDGTSRIISIQNVTDRLVQRAAGDILAPVAETLLSNSSYAYRRGSGVKGAVTALRTALEQGFSSGLKADISAFYDSIDREILFSGLEGLFPFEPLINSISVWADEMNPQEKGILQGSPLSPLLSNLYLNRFDRDMEKAGFRLIRYSDDFVLMFDDKAAGEDALTSIEASLGKLGLSLKHEKTTEVRQGVPLTFLGHVVSRSGCAPAEDKDTVPGKKEWHPVFKDEWLDGTPVYLSSICRGAFSSGPNLVVKFGDEKDESIPWNRISRIIIVGRSAFTSGVIYRAVKEAVPVSFIDILGRAMGSLFPEEHEMADIASRQQKHTKDEGFTLSFSKEVVSAKIHNSAVLLRRNKIDLEELGRLSDDALKASDSEVLRGIEGNAARLYFSKFAELVEPFEFRGRVYHPPDGPVNVMLSLGYSLLYNRLSAALSVKGFNPRIGFFHHGRGAHAALASDLMEELRHVVERIVLSLIHMGEIGEKDFTSSKKQEVVVCRFTNEGFRKFIHRYESVMSSKFTLPDKEQISCNGYLDEIAEKLKRSLKLEVPYTALRIH